MDSSAGSGVRQPLGIPDQGRGEFCADPCMVFSRHGQMERAPRPPLAHAVLAHLPFPFAIDFQAGGVNDDMAGLWLRQTTDLHRQCPARRLKVL